MKHDFFRWCKQNSPKKRQNLCQESSKMLRKFIFLKTLFTSGIKIKENFDYPTVCNPRYNRNETDHFIGRAINQI